jgi:hypothetical protein
MSYTTAPNISESATFDFSKFVSSSEKTSMAMNASLAQKFCSAILAGGLIQGISVDVADDSYTARYPITTHVSLNGDQATSLPKTSAVLDPLYQLVTGALHRARYEVFESGMESSFGKFVNQVVLLHGQKGLAVLNSALQDKPLSEDVLVEAIRTLASIDGRRYKMERFRLILRYLDHKSPIVRDAAALAFADMGDKGAISYLQAAARREKVSVVRNSFLDVAKELEEA